MNTLDADPESVWPAVGTVWPELAWNDAVFKHGAFHLVAVLGASAVVRITTGTSHALRGRREQQNLRALESADFPFRVPQVLAEVHSTPLWSAQLISRVPGNCGAGLSWAEARGPLDAILTGLRETGPPKGGLRPVREWCGGQDWPATVDRIVYPLGRAARAAAGRVVADVMETEAGVEAALVHGDFGLHNILWSGKEPSGVIDFDNSCVGDPAMDLAPLIGTYGSARVADITDNATLARARLHRASLPLQVAAAADLVEDGKLRDFALGNFQTRLQAGTLEDPGA